MNICGKYRLIPQKYNGNNNNMAYSGGLSRSGRCGFVVCVVRVWGYRKAHNRLQINILF